ncbi:MAG: tRNA 4-thiouridine(8) synthase ThiI [Methanomicrobiales archaeon]|nr:tRNA 4-thiouridine(8) synthase ThiI [Methanomicrobiales archaeon]
MEMLWLVRYSEIFLKSDPVRRHWERILIANIKTVLPTSHVNNERGRIWLRGEVDPEKLLRVFGIASFSPCEMVPLTDLVPAVLDFCSRNNLTASRSFAVWVKRVGKHKFHSTDLARQLGSVISETYPQLQVNLDTPERELFVEVRNDNCYLFTEVIRGPGGIPLGVEGTLVSLLSGGIDSPVAAWMMMKRGCRIIPIFIRLERYLDETTAARVSAVMERLRQYQPDIVLKTIEDSYLSGAKQVLAGEGAEKFTCLICKRRMYRLAEEVAHSCGAKGIVTGESLGQVASQTLDNLQVLSKATTLPFYRPLIGLDKEEIIRIAREIGTFLPSTKPATGCTAVPEKPATTADSERIRRLEGLIQARGSSRRIPGDHNSGERNVLP